MTGRRRLDDPPPTQWRVAARDSGNAPAPVAVDSGSEVESDSENDAGIVNESG